MKKLFLTVLATVICMASGANAILNSDLEKQNERQYEYEYTLKRACEMCPFGDRDMCRDWKPNCPEEEKSCLYNTLTACEAKCKGTCKTNTSGCFECYLTLKCKASENLYFSETLCKNANTGIGTCKLNNSNNCWYFVAGVCPFETLMECSSSCSGTCRTTTNGCYMCAQAIDIGLTTGGDNSGDEETTGTTSDTNTVSGSCPTGTKKSSDGCCCVPN